MAIFPTSAIPSAAGAGGYSIDQSLRFNDDDSAYLSWTPSSAGNRKTWSFSAWVKLSNTTNMALFGAIWPYMYIRAAKFITASPPRIPNCSCVVLGPGSSLGLYWAHLGLAWANLGTLGPGPDPPGSTWACI